MPARPAPTRRRRPGRWLLLAACACLPAWAAPVSITIYADDHYPPYSYVDNGQLTGIYTLIMQKALERLPEYQVQLAPVPWKRGVLMLEKGEAFALYPPYFRPDERRYMKYSEPMLTEQLVVFCNADVIARRGLKNWPADYYGLRVGMNAGFLAGGKQFDEAVKAGRLRADAAHGSRANLLKLMLGRIDCYVNDRLSIQWEVARIKKEGLMVPGSLPVSETVELSAEQGHLGYTALEPAQYPFRDDFFLKFNAVIRDMKRSGEIKDMVSNFLLK
ncbi:substrate-binding periplasmic protein [Janthinobacterium fluminis]|uniref:ABC transporter substrate-binding protein n=1 Tax=Janthinobacterium fluminis TaxID=2987524 RepID=A0ABT5JTF2_9BURK|nr:ABC transporter substrate-binding protein [Janthinobacterium fluminis]MDC8756009.1 ABC transporter substrate-binding protein [Janthinobacterium fluminis]